MWIIITLVLAALLLLVVELVLLPGISVAGICALLANGGAVWLAFARYGNRGGLIVLAVIIVLSVVATILSLRARTWQRFSLKSQMDGTAQSLPQEHDVKHGDRGTALTRLAPMGKISVNGQTFEAKSIDAYIDPRTEVEVVGFENFNVIVQPVKTNN